MGLDLAPSQRGLAADDLDEVLMGPFERLGRRPRETSHLGRSADTVRLHRTPGTSGPNAPPVVALESRNADGRATAFGNVTLNRDATGAPEANGARFDEHGQRVVDGQGPLRWDESGLRSVSRNGRRRQHGPLLHGVQAVWLTVAGGQLRPELRLTAPTLSPLVWFDPAQGSVSRTALHTPTGDVDETPDWTVRSRTIDEDPTTTYGYQRFRSTANGGAWLNDAGARRFVPGAGAFLEPDPILPTDEDVLPALWLHARGDPYHVVDPDGRCGLVGAAVGGAVGAVLSGTFALYNGDDPATALARAVVGGLGGSVLGATCGLAASAGAGGVVGAFQGGVNTALDTRGAPLTLAELGRGALVGGVGGALAGVAGSYLGGRTDLNTFARLSLNTYADLGADLLAQGAGTALGGGPVDLQRAVFAAAFGTGVRAVHLGGASAAAAARARAAAVQREAAVFSLAFADEYTALRQLRGNLLYSTPVPYARELDDVVLATAHALRRYGHHRYAAYVQANPESWVVDRARGMCTVPPRSRHFDAGKSAVSTSGWA